MPTARLLHRPLLVLSLTLALLAPVLAVASPARAATCEVTNGNHLGPGSLRAAINRTENYTGSDCEVITFQADIHEVLVESYLLLDRKVTIEGPGAGALTIRYKFPDTYQNIGSIFWISGGDVTLRGLTIAGGRSQGISGAGLSILGNPGSASVTLDGVVLNDNRTKQAGGGGIYASNTTLALINSTVSANTSDVTGQDIGWGGGGLILDDYYGSVQATLTGSTVTANKAGSNSGGGIMVRDREANKSVTLSLTGSTIGGGTADAGNLAENGGGLFNSGGAVTMTNSSVSGNTASTFGGGIYSNQGAITLTNTTVGGNTAAAEGGGITNVESIATLSGVTISGNKSATNGGGVHNSNGKMTLTDSTVSANEAKSLGGGLHNTQASATLTLINVTVSGNSTINGPGGGLYNQLGKIELTNSTVSGNTSGMNGGGLYSDATVKLVATTIIGNHASSGGGGIHTYNITQIGRSIIAGNQAGAAAQDCSVSNTFTPLGYNLVGNGTGCPTTGTGDLTLTAALATVLDPTLAANGGPTKTHNLIPGGAAVDRIPAIDCGVTTDQRGVPRPQNSLCDIGSIEYIATPPSPTPSPSPSPPPCGQRFGDVPTADPACVAIEALASRSIINGCDSSATPPLFCPTDTTLRHQMAALIVRAMPGWSGETWPNTFTDPTDDAELWRRVGTLQHYGVVGGYTPESCQAQGKTPPCYGPLDPVLKAQAISFVTRAMVAKGYWVQQTTDPTLYGGALVGTGHETDTTTYWYYTRAKGGVPDYPEGGGFPLDQAAPRAWFARLLWTAIQGTPAAP